MTSKSKVSFATLVSGFVVVLALSVLGAELATRFDDWSRYGTPFSSNATDVGALTVRDHLGLHARPNAHFKHFRIDSLGFRGPNRSRKELEESFLLITSGASETFGLYESTDGEWPRQLERELRASSSDRQALVLNAAFAGMSLPTVAQDVRLRLSQLNPDVVIYYPTPAQYLFQDPPHPAVRDSISSQVDSGIRLRIFQRLRDAIKRLIPEIILEFLREYQTSVARESIQQSSSFSYVNNASERLSQFEADLRSLIGDIRSIGAEPVLVVHAHRFRDTTFVVDRQQLTAWAKFYPLASGSQLIEFDSLAADVTIRVAADSGVALADPREELLSDPSAMFADHTHFSDKGAEVVARSVRNAFRQIQ